jgi:hypothetical protein
MMRRTSPLLRTFHVVHSSLLLLLLLLILLPLPLLHAAGLSHRQRSGSACDCLSACTPPATEQLSRCHHKCHMHACLQGPINFLLHACGMRDTVTPRSMT